MSKELSIAAFFAGIGGIEEGFHSEGCKTVFFCEKDERAKAVLSYHYPDVPIADDITTVTSIPKVDIVTAGFPCQDLSQAGLKKALMEINQALFNIYLESLILLRTLICQNGSLLRMCHI